jgi:MOB kinase activator 1
MSVPHIRLFRVYAHIYTTHMLDNSVKEAEAHISTSFKHLLFFADEFNLLPESEKEPLKPLIDDIYRHQT